MAKVTVNTNVPHYNVLLDKVNGLNISGPKNPDLTQGVSDKKENQLVPEKLETSAEDFLAPVKTTLKTSEDGPYGKIDESKVLHNSCIPLLYHHALRFEAHTELTSTGALSCLSEDRLTIFDRYMASLGWLIHEIVGEKTGRSPLDKRTVLDDNTRDTVWWDSVNIPIDLESFNMNKKLAVDFINTNERIYVTDAFAGWDPDHRLKVRVVSIRAYHALFMHNLLIVPSQDELKDFKPDFTIYNAGPCDAKPSIPGVTSNTSICINYTSMEMIILGSEYAGEMKKGILTLMMYILPQKGLLPLHSSCNVDASGNVTLFFGLSGTGKTTLSTEPNRLLIGDDEHVWTDRGVFNIEGGCYAKCKDLSKDHEPEIFDAIKFGSVLENVVLDETNKVVDYKDVSITENTRCAYPLEFIKNVKLPALVNNHPNNVIFLTCDAFGALPPVSLLNTSQAIYHFVSGYTTKMVGTEIGVNKPTATFSACYAGPFLALSPLVYADLLYEKLSGGKTKEVPAGVSSGPEEVLGADAANLDGMNLDKASLGADSVGGNDDPGRVNNIDNKANFENPSNPGANNSSLDFSGFNGNIRVWLLNTGWIGGSIDSPNGRRIPLKYSRRIVDAINNDEISRDPKDFDVMPYFGILVPRNVNGVPREVLNQQLSWPDREHYLQQVETVAAKFVKNFNQYRSRANSLILRGEPKLTQA
ncbi:phosphoenolpyruvate carboxykinase [Theileria orientalis strain Shintoku]|uniref:phosphoenolpyruvate carboxykinase (ATP) n=1 Tax=Theileria orientalis strain Shintoku TaxID=869250 RepID=J4C2M8_THEOR|nr:phosphoenolpyruvate carboxykinase [Theileria orientalis strain Shintoku]BAM38966.1 phosphoenolpyruvate carboxykinase [Theileria orientalis strain Shintoku]|eukprot:XP_009689267.1 phosphoenolpyruvate carboxykinase [Theileria orientalis strain Shintoku]